MNGIAPISYILKKQEQMGHTVLGRIVTEKAMTVTVIALFVMASTKENDKYQWLVLEQKSQSGA